MPRWEDVVWLGKFAGTGRHVGYCLASGELLRDGRFSSMTSDVTKEFVDHIGELRWDATDAVNLADTKSNCKLDLNEEMRGDYGTRILQGICYAG